ncbi:unnamed protein product [Camellia sinensis]
MVSVTQGSTVAQPLPVANPFGTLPAMPQMSIGRSGIAPSIQYGISSLPVVDKPALVRISSLLTSRHLSQRRIRLPARKYHPKNDGPKANALFIPRENPRALVIRPLEQWPPRTNVDKASPLKDTSSPTHENVDSFAVARDNEMHEATRRILSVLLRQIDGFEQEKKVVVIAATSRKQDLDPDLIRFTNIHQQTCQEIAAQYAKHLAKSNLAAFAKVTEESIKVMMESGCEEVCCQWLMWQSYGKSCKLWRPNKKNLNFFKDKSVAVFSAEPWTVPWTAKKTILQSQEMEYATKPPSNISDIVSKFAKVCRFRSIGVFSTENPTHNHQPIIDFGNNVPSSEDSSDATEEAECDIEKIHPNPVEIQPKTTECVNMEILKLCHLQL